MITLLNKGEYTLIETKHHHKVLYLGAKVYAWVEPLHIGSILVTSHSLHKTDCILSSGRYFIYDVDDEPFLNDQQHLELEVDTGRYQGYLLLSGLPNKEKKRGRIIPTGEIITNNPRFTNSASAPRGKSLARKEKSTV